MTKGCKKLWKFKDHEATLRQSMVKANHILCTYVLTTHQIVCFIEFRQNGMDPLIKDHLVFGQNA